MLTDKGRSLWDLGDKTAALNVQIENLQENLKSLGESLGAVLHQSSFKRPSFRWRTPPGPSVSISLGNVLSYLATLACLTLNNNV